eukprot:6149061-Pyramimonas_sp.AAC.1
MLGTPATDLTSLSPNACLVLTLGDALHVFLSRCTSESDTARGSLSGAGEQAPRGAPSHTTNQVVNTANQVVNTANQ